MLSSHTMPGKQLMPPRYTLCPARAFKVLSKISLRPDRIQRIQNAQSILSAYSASHTRRQDRQSNSQCAGERRPRHQFLYKAYSRSALYGVHTILVGSTCGRCQLSAAATRWCNRHGQEDHTCAGISQGQSGKGTPRCSDMRFGNHVSSRASQRSAGDAAARRARRRARAAPNAWG